MSYYDLPMTPAVLISVQKKNIPINSLHRPAWSDSESDHLLNFSTSNQLATILQTKPCDANCTCSIQLIFMHGRTNWIDRRHNGMPLPYSLLPRMDKTSGLMSS